MSDVGIPFLLQPVIMTGGLLRLRSMCVRSLAMTL